MNTPYRIGHFEAAADHLVFTADYLLADIENGDRPNPVTVADFRRQIERLRCMVQANTRRTA